MTSIKVWLIRLHVNGGQLNGWHQGAGPMRAWQLQVQAHLHVMQLLGLTAFCLDAGQLNGGNNVLNPYVNSNVNASSVAQQLVSGATAAGQLARSVLRSDTLCTPQTLASMCCETSGMPVGQLLRAPIRISSAPVTNGATNCVLAASHEGIAQPVSELARVRLEITNFQDPAIPGKYLKESAHRHKTC